MTRCDPMAVAIDWLDAYRTRRVDEIVAMHSADAVIDCACERGGAIQGKEGIAAYWQRRIGEDPSLELLDFDTAGREVVIVYRTNNGIVEALLDIAEDGLITHCACGRV